MFTKIRAVVEKWYPNIKNVCNVLITVCTVVTAIASVVLAKQALDISEIALESTSSSIEPILDIEVDWESDRIKVFHETADIFQIKYVTFAKVRTVAVMKNDVSKISSLEILEDSIMLNLEQGHTVGTDCSKEEAERLNKSFELQLEDSSLGNISKDLDLLEKNIEDGCDKNKCIYWGVSPHYNYRYIIVEYVDVYGNRRNQYYIYKNEYSSTWRFYKLSEEAFGRYTKDVIDFSNEQELYDKIFDETNYKIFDETKYSSFAEWNNMVQFK